MMPGAGDTDYVYPADDLPPDEGTQEYCKRCGDFVESCDGHADEGPELKLTQEDAPRYQDSMFPNTPQRATDEEHISDEGTRCPLCRSDEIEGGEISTGGGGGHQEMWCLECSATWHDHYALVGYTTQGKAAL